jgi:hypothetical protein
MEAPATVPADGAEEWALRAPGGQRIVVPPSGLVLGREAAGAQWLDDRTSRRHARVEPHVTGLRVCDLRSRNGTRLDLRPVGSGGDVARAGQELTIGGTTFRIERLSVESAPTDRLETHRRPAGGRRVR